jgi:hypothetical protein
MASPAAASPMDAGGETPNQRQARERRERRQAKIQTGGSARLQKIAGLSGRPHAAAEEAAKAQNLNAPAANNNAPVLGTSPPATRPHQASAEDPDITDISEHHYTPRTTPRAYDSGRSTPIPGMDLSQMQFPPPQGGQQGNEDPMMRMMQQMLGGGDPNAQLPPGLAEMMSSLGGGGPMPGMPGQEGQQQAAQPSSSAYLWRIVHFFFSFGLALYVTMSTPFTGTKAARTASQYNTESGESFSHRLFYWFATAEVVLQSSRYFLERGQLPQSGLLGTLAAIVPQPYGGYLRVIGRYSVIYTTVVADAMVIVFVLGAMAWWNGAVVT